MVFNSFKVKIFIRLILLVVTAFAAAICLYYFGFYYTTFIITAVFISLVVEFFRFANKTNQDLNHFLLSIKYGDYSQKYSPHPEKSLRELRETFNLVTEEFQRLKMEKETNYIFLQTAVEYIPIAMICYEEKSGNVLLLNNAAKKLIGVEYIPQISFLEKSNKRLINSIMAVEDGQQEFFKLGGEIQEDTISVIKRKITVADTSCFIVVIQNIRNELDLHEIEVWQKFVRVVTHEIMNSITPISSLTETLKEMVREEMKDMQHHASKEMLIDIQRGLDAIGNRCNSLTDFVSSYRKLTRIPLPQKKHFKVHDLFSRLQTLYGEDMLNNHIDFSVYLSDHDMELFADRDQLEQALINLVNNARDVVRGTKDAHIKLAAYAKGKNIELVVYDNGIKLDEDILDKIFIPFFSTKSGGSGIGLTLTRQLVINNAGTVFLSQQYEIGKAFHIKF